MLRPMYNELRAEYPIEQFIDATNVVTNTPAKPETFYDACAEGNLSVTQSMVRSTQTPPMTSLLGIRPSRDGRAVAPVTAFFGGGSLHRNLTCLPAS